MSAAQESPPVDRQRRRMEEREETAGAREGDRGPERADRGGRAHGQCSEGHRGPRQSVARVASQEAVESWGNLLAVVGVAKLLPSRRQEPKETLSIVVGHRGDQT